MKKTAHILLLALFATNFYGQEYFNNRYDFYGITENGSTVIELLDGYYIAGGAVDSASLNLEVAVMKTDLQGNLQWKKSYGQEFYNYFHGASTSMVQTIEGNFAMAGGVDDTTGNDDVMLYMFDSNGDTLWTKRYTDAGFDTGYQLKQTEDSGFIIVGAETKINTEVLLIKTDKNGNIQWKKNYDYGFNSYCHSIEICQDKGYLIGGSNNAPQRRTLIIKTDSVGNVEWDKQYAGFFDNCKAVIKESFSGEYIIGTCMGVFEQQNQEYQRTRIIKIDTNGNEVWDSLYGPASQIADAFSIVELSNTDIVLIGQAYWPEGYIIKVSTEGDSLWYRTYEHLTGPQSLNYPRDMQPTTDGGFVVSGWCTPAPPDVGSQDMWVIKLDSMGCAVAGCDTLVSIKPKVKSRKDDVKVYPNPASTSVTIEYSGNQPQAIQLFDITGRQAAGWELQKGNSEHDVSHLPAGVYFYRVGTITGKLIIQ